MVPLRIFQNIGCLAFGLLWVCPSPNASAEPAPKEVSSDLDHSQAILVSLTATAGELEQARQSLSEFSDIRFPRSPELQATLSERPFSPYQKTAQANLSSCQVSLLALDFESAIDSAIAAAVDYAAIQAQRYDSVTLGTQQGIEIRFGLEDAYQCLFQSAHAAKRRDLANYALERLAEQESSESLDDAESYLQVDATSAGQHFEVRFVSDPVGAELWLDHAELEKTPTLTLLSPGLHIVAARLGDRVVSQSFTVRGPGEVVLAPKEVTRSWAGLEPLLPKLRASRGGQREEVVQSIMAATGVDIAFLAMSGGEIAVWILPEGFSQPERIGVAANGAAAGLMAQRGLAEASRDIFAENPDPTPKAESNRRWWIFGAILGAAAVGTGLIVANDLRSDTQKIEVVLP